jgi:hypothetical protein
VIRIERRQFDVHAFGHNRSPLMSGARRVQMLLVDGEGGFEAAFHGDRSSARLLGSLGERKPSFGHFDEKGLMF